MTGVRMCGDRGIGDRAGARTSAREHQVLDPVYEGQGSAAVSRIVRSCVVPPLRLLQQEQAVGWASTVQNGHTGQNYQKRE